jgi:hypothetical protein
MPTADETTQQQIEAAPVTVQTVRDFRRLVDARDWQMDMAEFCRVTGFRGDYAVKKWRDWQALVAAFGQFDNETLARILRPGCDVENST